MVDVVLAEQFRIHVVAERRPYSGSIPQQGTSHGQRPAQAPQDQDARRGRPARQGRQARQAPQVNRIVSAYDPHQCYL